MRYSNDLRAKAIDLIINKNKQQNKIAKFLSIDKSTIFRWIKKHKETGNSNYIENYDTGRPAKISTKSDIEKFKKFIIDNNNLSLKELAHKWGNITAESIRKNLKKLDYSFKKNPSYMPKEMNSLKKNSQKRLIISKIKDIS